MFRVLFTGDWHLGCTVHSSVDRDTNVPTRVTDFEHAAESLLMAATVLKLDRVVNMGDLYHVNSPISTWIARSITLHKRHINLKSRWDYHAFDGNHDFAGRAGRRSATGPLVEAFKDEASFVWYAAPRLVEEWAPGVRALVIPHGSPPVDVEFPDDEKTNLVLCHTTVEGAVSGAEETLLADKVRALGSIQGRVDAYFSGHIHKPQMFRYQGEWEAPALVVYPGSIERIDFGERDEQKSAVIVDLHELREKGEGAIQRYRLDSRPMIQAEFWLGQDVETWLGDVSRFQDAIVKVVVRGHERDSGGFSPVEIRRRILEAGANYVSGFSMDIERERVVKDSGMTERLTPDAAFSRYVERSIVGEGHEEQRFRAEVLQHGARILQEASRGA